MTNKKRAKMVMVLPEFPIWAGPCDWCTTARPDNDDELWFKYVCPECGRRGCPECMPAGLDCACPECERGEV